jgi:hypothetical protein
VTRDGRQIRAGKWLQFRKIGESHWVKGQAERVTRSRLLFTTAESVEVGDNLELVLPGGGEETRSRSVRSGEVVRRILMNWPNLDILIGVRLRSNVRPAH